MLLHRLFPDPRCREARRDLSNPYELHSTLCRAFSSPEAKCPEGTFMWRMEPEVSSEGLPKILVQSQELPDWSYLRRLGWICKEPDPVIDLTQRLKLNSLQLGRCFRFRLRANPSVVRAKKRQGLLKLEDQKAWLVRKGLEHGFEIHKSLSFELVDSESSCLDVQVSHEQMLRGKRRDGTLISIYSVLFDGTLSVVDVEKFRQALHRGIGHGKAMGLGLLSVVPIA